MYIVDLGVIRSIKDPIEIFCDNEGAIAQAKEPRSHHNTKHILCLFPYIREIVERGDVCIRKVHMDLNLVDPFTKALSGPKHEGHARSIGLRYL